MRITYETNDFRRHEPMIVKDKSGNDMKMILCEELDPDSGRWEPFCAISDINNS